MSDYVIKYWRYGSKPVDEHGNYVHVFGQRAGLWATLMPLMGIDPAVKLLVGLERAEYRCAALSGAKIHMIPLEQISSCYFGHHKPLGAALALLGVFTVLAALAGSQFDLIAGLGLFIVGLVLGALLYLRGSRLVLGLRERSGKVHEFRFARTTLESVDINEQQARQINKVIQRLIDAKQKRMGVVLGSA